MNSTVALIVLLLPLASYALWPLFTADAEDSTEPVDESSTPALEQRKNAAYAALKEAEFDRRTGKLSDEDYEKLVARYKNQALEAIAALEKQRGADRSPGVPTGKAKFCAQCGTALGDGAKFCAGCGAKLAA